eukprot:9124481-Lingulodinium_polyedra.AAC.1
MEHAGANCPMATPGGTRYYRRLLKPAPLPRTCWGINSCTHYYRRRPRAGPCAPNTLGRKSLLTLLPPNGAKT